MSQGGLLTLGSNGKYQMGPAPSMKAIDDAYENNNPQQTQYQYPQHASNAQPFPEGEKVRHRSSETLNGQQSSDQQGDGTKGGPGNAGREDEEKPQGDSENDEEDAKDGGESGEKEKTPTPVGFWDPSLSHVRKEAMWKWALTTAVLMLFIWGVMSIYWASLFTVDQKISALAIAVVDFDGQAPYNTGNTPIVGPEVTRLALQQLQNPSHLGYVSEPPSMFNNDPIQVRQAVYDFKYWAAIIINPNATAMLYSAIQNANTSYDPMGACQLVYMDSRDDTNWYDFMYPLISTLLTQATTSVGSQFTSTALQQASTNTTLLANLQRVPQALSPAIGFSMFNLRPFYPYTTIPAVTVGLIYLIIISFFSFAFYLPIHVKYLKPQGHPPLKFYQLVIWRYFATLLAYFFLSFAYSLISLMFQINFSGGNPVTSETQATVISFGNPDAYGKGTFPVYWMLNFVGMIALGLACENVAMIVGQPWTGLWLIFWVITNVSTAFYDVEIEPGFYLWGYAWPLHNIVEASRQLLFGLKSNVGLNFGILFAWGLVNTILFPLCCMWMRFKTRHGLHEYWA